LDSPDGGMISDNRLPSVLDPKISRRALFAGAFASLVVVASRSTPGLGLKTLVGERESDTVLPILALGAASAGWSFADVVSHVGSEFDLVSAVGVLPITLIEAVAAPVRTSGQMPISGEAFSLLFEGAAGLVAPEDTHLLRHSTLPDATHFISPVGRGRKVQDYQVIVDQRIFASGSVPKKAG
jgi:hypothetical protein